MRRRTCLGSLVLLVLVAGCGGGDEAGSGEGLARRYPGGAAVGVGVSDWPLSPQDVWRLDGFHLRHRDELAIELGPSRVVFGVRGRGPEAAAVWAVVLPDEPAPLTTTLPGGGEQVKSLFLRFPPERVGELFPAATVSGPAPPDALVPVRWIYQHRIATDWRAQAPPARHSLDLDVETQEGTRRVYTLDGAGARWREDFGDRGLRDPPGGAMNRIQALEAFDVAWDAIDAHYPLFALRPEVDWDALRRTYRPVAARARTRYQVAGTIALMLDALRDLHVFVRVGREILAGFEAARPPNGSWAATAARVRDLHESGRDVNWGWLGEDIGYVEIRSLAEARENRQPGGRRQFTGAFDAALAQLADSRGLILDLRFNWGGIRNMGVGDVNMALRVSGRFLDEERVYGGNRERTGSVRDELGEIEPLSVLPRLSRYAQPVAVLIGPRTSGMAESLALMLAQNPAAALVGDTTAGVGGTQARVTPLGEDLWVAYPVALHTDPRGEPLDGTGVAPDLRVELSAEAAGNGADPVLASALEWLRERAD